MKTLICFLTTILFFACSHKEEKSKETKTAEQAQLDSLNKVAFQTLGQNPNRARLLAEENVAKAKLINYQSGVAEGLKIVGVTFYYQGDYQKAVNYYNESLVIYQELDNSDGAANVLNNIGVAFEAQGEYEKAQTNLLKVLKIDEEQKDSAKMAVTCRNIGRIFHAQKNLGETMIWYQRSEKMLEVVITKNPDSPDNFTNLTNLAYVTNSIGTIFEQKEDYEKAKRSYDKFKKVATLLGDTKLIAESYASLANIFQKQRNYLQALELFQKSEKLASEINYKRLVTLTKLNIGRVKLALNNPQEAEQEFKESLKLAEEMNDRWLIKEASGELAYLYSEKQDKESLKNAFHHLERYSNLSDSLQSAEAQKLIKTFETEKKDKEITLLTKDKELQKNTKNFFIALSVLIVAFAGFALLAFLKERKRKRLIESQKKEIEHQKKDLTDSITYAKRIQEAILVPQERIKQVLPESFVMFLPKDIVSGDFYWFHQNDQSIFIAAADCTGHGVPGAFVSMVGANTLNEIVKQVTEPSAMLSALNQKMKAALNQSGEGKTKDGMEIALCKIEKQNGKTKLTFAGANRPMYLVREKEILEYKGTRNTPIGGDTPEDAKYGGVSLEPLPGDVFYISSDGYADQNGGPKRRKIMKRGFQELLVEISNLPMTGQEEKLRQFITDWRGEKEQVDDVLVIGLRF